MSPVNVIGMISGTSFDAIEAAVVEFELDGTTIDARLIAHASLPYPDDLRDRIARILPPQSTTIEEVGQLDTLIGQCFADAAADLSGRFCNDAVDVVCSHGQTVFHWVDGGHARGTLQLGQAAWIAERTGATVVSDVRSRDVAAGGHGAPLASLLDVLLLGKNPSVTRGALNLGGIANLTVVGPRNEPIAFDVGPANALMDAVVTDATVNQESFDRDGERAARGVVHPDLLARLLDDPFYDYPAPKSTGKEYFHLDYVKRHSEGLAISTDDLVATLCELTAVTVADAVHSHQLSELFASGGGTRNPSLMARLGRLLPDVNIALSDELGVPEAAKEALLFALIGFLSVHGVEGNVPSCTGARSGVVLGTITPGRRTLTHLAREMSPTSLRCRSSHE